MAARTSLKRAVITGLTIAIFIVPAGVGFGNKFLELVYLAMHEEASFTIMPILNYLLASLAFFALFFWAVWHGMFHDVESPKMEMMDREHFLDELEHEGDDVELTATL